MTPPVFVYYCSGHGYGHATRVSALASHLLRLPAQYRPQVHIVSEAPKHVFADSLAVGAQYRFADWIDPVIVQPVAYRIDRQKSVNVLKAFVNKKDVFIETERAWLVGIGARCVLSDAAFLGCLAAKAAGVPSILVTNFTFDSVYSYLSTTFIDAEQPSNQEQQLAELLLPSDTPIPYSVIEPLVRQIHDGYRHADLLLLLPGQIPIPAFSTYPPLPSPAWIDLTAHAFHGNIVSSIDPNRLVAATEHELGLSIEDYDETIRATNTSSLYPHIPFPPNTALHAKSVAGGFKRKVLDAPLLVRSPTTPSDSLSDTKQSVYTPEGRSRLLSSIGVPKDHHDPEKTKILIVSFGGQVFRTPVSGRNTPRRRSGSSSPRAKPKKTGDAIGMGLAGVAESTETGKYFIPNSNEHGNVPTPSSPPPPAPSSTAGTMTSSSRSSSSGSFTLNGVPFDHRDIDPDPKPRSLQLINMSPVPDSPGQAMWIPGAPSPALVPCSVFASPLIPFPIQDDDSEDSDGDHISFNVVPATPALHNFEEQEEFWEDDLSEGVLPSLLPDESWIAIVCGVSKDQWEKDQDGDGGLPENFYVAPKDVYMPDLTASADVLLGKLGYGTVAECVDSRTPVVFVPRPLFIEEHGLKLLLEESNVPGVQLTREEYEKGEWAGKVHEAWMKGKEGKNERREEELTACKIPGMFGIEKRQREGREMAMKVVEWVDQCWNAVEPTS